MKKHYKIAIRTMDDQRIEFVVESDNLLNLLQDLKGNRMTFIPAQNPDRGSFTIFSSYIKTMEYNVMSVMPFEKIATYMIHSS